jgi:hypothetical protein
MSLKLVPLKDAMGNNVWVNPARVIHVKSDPPYTRIYLAGAEDPVTIEMSADAVVDVLTAQPRLGPRMDWQTHRPAAPGYYWLRLHDGEVEPVEVRIEGPYGELLEVVYIGIEEPDALEDETFNDARWLAIEPPIAP